MKAGQKGTVAEISGGSILQGRMMSMGIYHGREIIKLSHFAMKGPVAIKVGRVVLALGHGMAMKVHVNVSEA